MKQSEKLLLMNKRSMNEGNCPKETETADPPNIFHEGDHKNIKAANGYGKKTGKCGDTIEFFLTVDNGILKTVSYNIQGCEYTNACASSVVLLAEGKKIEQAWEITPDMVFDDLQNLPQDHFHCAELAAGTLYLAMTDFQQWDLYLKENR